MKRYPKSDEALIAVQVILDMYNREGDVESLGAQARFVLDRLRIHPQAGRGVDVDVDAGQLPVLRVAPGDAVVIGPDAHLECFGIADAFETSGRGLRSRRARIRATTANPT